jgi:CO/xanthine dehydrogenase Mo-binding subunit
VTTEQIMGAPLKRREDQRFITGKGRYLDDIQMPGMTYMAQQPLCACQDPGHRHHRRGAMPGVVAVFTGLTSRNPLPMAWPAGGASGLQNNVNVPRVLATDDVKWTGEGVAAVVAETAEQARDALDLIEVDWEPLPAVVDAEKATQPGAPQLHENAPNNVVRVVGRRQGRHRCRHRWRRGRRPPADRQPAAHPEPDGDARRHRLVQPGHRRVHRLDVEPDTTHPASAVIAPGHPEHKLR